MKRNAYIAQILFLCVFTMTMSACASLKSGQAGNVRTYKSDANLVIEKVSGLLEQLNLNIEDQGWEVADEQFKISAYELNRVFQGAEGTVRSASILVTIEKLSFNQTRVSMKTSRRAAPSMASSAGSTVNHEREFFSRLDEILPIYIPEDES